MECKVKVCGVKSAAFAREAVRKGVSFLGFIFAPASPRFLTPAEAREIAAKLPRTVKRVGVFTDHPVEEILSVARLVGLDIIQLHGSYKAEDVAALKASGYGVWLLDDGGTPPNLAGADALLVDGRKGNRTGGTGCLADWSRVAVLKNQGIRVVLAGGLGPENAAAAARTGADILDFNGKLETTPGEKSLALLDAALARLREA